MLKKNIFFDTIFCDFLIVLASKNDSKIEVFRMFSENVDFVKNLAFT